MWLPATSHALLEQAGWIHDKHAEESDSSGSDYDHDAADGTCLVASNDIQVQTAVETGAALTLAFLYLSLKPSTPLEPMGAFSNDRAPPGAVPLELSPTWQFSFRASLPPRAPSVIS